jgi:hypothetical protein
MNYKLILITMIILASSGCIDRSGTFTGNIKTFTPINGSLSGELRLVEITFDEGNLYIPDTIYITRDEKISEKLYKAYIQHKKVTVNYTYLFPEDHDKLSIISVDIID